MLRPALVALLACIALPAAAQNITMTGGVQTPGGQPVTLTPFAQFIQSCNSGAGGIVGQGGCTAPGGGGGGGGAITAAAGSYAVGALLDGSIVTLGTQADAACSTDNGTCTGTALLKRENQRLTSLITALGSPFQAGGSIGNTGFNVLQGGAANSATNPIFVANYEPTYMLLGVKGGAGASSSGSAVGPVYGASYILACSGTIAGATLQLQVLAPDGVTFQNVTGAGFTALPGNLGVTLGSTQGSVTANVKMLVTGATGTPSVFCSLS